MSYQHMKSHRKDNTVVRLSYPHNGILYVGNIYLYWNEARCVNAAQYVVTTNIWGYGKGLAELWNTDQSEEWKEY